MGRPPHGRGCDGANGFRQKSVVPGGDPTLLASVRLPDTRAVPPGSRCGAGRGIGSLRRSRRRGVLDRPRGWGLGASMLLTRSAGAQGELVLQLDDAGQRDLEVAEALMPASSEYAWAPAGITASSFTRARSAGSYSRRSAMNPARTINVSPRIMITPPRISTLRVVPRLPITAVTTIAIAQGMNRPGKSGESGV